MNQSEGSAGEEESKHNVTTTSIGTGKVGYPEEVDKLKADFDMQLGRYYQARLKYGVEHFGQPLEENAPELYAKMQ